MLDIVILAAGQGTRMQSSLPKVLHCIAGKPMIKHVIDAGRALKNCRIHVVIGHGADKVREVVTDEDINWILQNEQLGTGHAVAQALPFLRHESTVLVLYGDVPLINPVALQQLVDSVGNSSIALLTVALSDPSGYGRIIRNDAQEVLRIVEHKDASVLELAIQEVNTGILAAKARDLGVWLPQLDNANINKEFYLTDIVAMARAEKRNINALCVSDEWEVLGVNDRSQQSRLERIYQRRQAKELMTQGVTLLDPDRFDCRGTIKAGKDVVIDINVILEGNVVLGDNVVIEANCVIKDSSIGSGSHIRANTLVEKSVIHANVNVGPFARLRPGTVLCSGSRVGNFVEIKNSELGEDSKANHLAYIGDTEVGKGCNIGAGTITCNYDGVNKYKTVLRDNVFIGSNSTLVAPLVIESGGFVGAGSTITKHVPVDNLAIGRGQQRNIDGWSRPKK